MPVTININGLSLAHKGNGGLAQASAPDVCLTPGPPSPVPIPYPNIAVSADLVDGTTSVLVDGGNSVALLGSKLCKSSGDEAGVAGGVSSGMNMSEAAFITFSPNVMMDGKPVCRKTDKLLMNMNNTVCNSGHECTDVPVVPYALQDCDPPPLLVELEAPKPCVIDSVLLGCAHDGRTQILNIPESNHDLLNIVANKTKEVDELRIQGAGSCETDADQCGTIVVEQVRPLKLVYDSSKHGRQWPELSAKTDSSPWLGGAWLDFVKNAFSLTTLPSNVYQVTGSTCSQPPYLIGAVRVFPKAGWSGKFELGEQPAALSRANNQWGKPARIKPVFRGEISAHHGSHSLTFAAGIEGDLKSNADPNTKFINPLGKLLNVLEPITAFVEKAKAEGKNPKGLPIKKGLPIEPTFMLPYISIGGGSELVEASDGPGVFQQGSFDLKFDPLIGAGIKIDIVDLIATAVNPTAAEVIAIARKRAKEGIDIKGVKVRGVLECNFTIKGIIEGGVNAKFPKMEASGSIAGKIPFGIQGEISAEGQVFKMFAAKAGLRFGSSSAESLSMLSEFSASLRLIGRDDPDNPIDLDGRVGFSGLTLYAIGFYEFGANNDENENREIKDKNRSVVEATAGDEAEFHHTFIPEKKLPFSLRSVFQ